MSTHSKAAEKFIADKDRTAWHNQALWFVREKRDRMARSVPEWEALREAAARTKIHTVTHLAHYLEMFERNATANGIHVHWAKDAQEHNEIVYGSRANPCSPRNAACPPTWRSAASRL